MPSEDVETKLNVLRDALWVLERRTDGLDPFGDQDDIRYVLGHFERLDEAIKREVFKVEGVAHAIAGCIEEEGRTGSECSRIYERCADIARRWPERSPLAGEKG